MTSYLPSEAKPEVYFIVHLWAPYHEITEIRCIQFNPYKINDILSVTITAQNQIFKNGNFLVQIFSLFFFWGGVGEEDTRRQFWEGKGICEVVQHEKCRVLSY